MQKECLASRHKSVYAKLFISKWLVAYVERLITMELMLKPH